MTVNCIGKILPEICSALTCYSYSNRATFNIRVWLFSLKLDTHFLNNYNFRNYVAHFNCHYTSYFIYVA